MSFVIYPKPEKNKENVIRRNTFLKVGSDNIIPETISYTKDSQQQNSSLALIENRSLCWKYAILYSFLATLLYADQNILAPNLNQIKKEFNMDDKVGDKLLGGYINMAFFLLGVPSALTVGYLTDRVDRMWLMFVVMIIGQGPNMFAPLITRYAQLFLVRCITGVSVGGTFPLVFSILGDLFPPEQRSLVSIIVAISLGGGGSLGQAIAGYVGASYGWKLPLLIVSLPNVVLAAYVYMTCVDPPRGASESTLKKHFQQKKEFKYQSQLDFRKITNLILTPSNFFAILQGLPGCLPWGVVIVFLNDYLAVDQNLGIHIATNITVIFGLGGTLGVVVGGLIGQYLYNKRREYMCIYIGITVMVGMLPLYYFLNADLTQQSRLKLYSTALFWGIASCQTGVNVRSILLNVNIPEARGLAMGLHVTLDDVGKGLGPVINAYLIQIYGRKKSFNLSLFGWVLCGLCLIACAFFIRSDEHKMQLDLLKSANESERESNIQLLNKINREV